MKPQELLQYTMYTLALLLAARVFGYRNPLLAAIIFSVAGAVFISTAKKGKHGAWSFLFGLGMLGIAVQLLSGGVSLYAVSPAAKEALTSTPLTDFFLNATNLFAVIWAAILKYKV